MEPFVLVISVLLLGLFFRLIAGGFDGERVERYVSDRGWTLLDRSWQPFGPGWFGEKDSRIYQIVFRDEHGDTRRAHVKTSMLSGVYLTDDHVVERAARDEPAAAKISSEEASSQVELERENERLRARLRELEERGRGDG